MSFKVSVKGIKELRRSIGRLPEDFIKGAERAVLRAGGAPIVKAAKARAPIGSGPHPGLLKKSIGMNVRKVGSIISARIGPRTGFRVQVGTKKLRKNLMAKRRDGSRILAASAGTEVPVFKDPNKYSHLVELGTSKSPAKPFIRPAIDAASSETHTAMAKGYEKHLTKTITKLRTRR
jgi:HK97 gp10 family phage protein